MGHFMSRESLSVRRVLIAIISFVPNAGFAEPTPDESTGIEFRAAEGTGLSEILKDRRLLLEKRHGTLLTGHQWWLWGLGSFDFDRDGDIDLIVCVHGSTNGAILRNQLAETGKLTFVDVTKELGIDGFVPSTDNYPLMWDFDGDGHLDIAGLLDDRKTPCLLNQGGKQFARASFSLHPINYPNEIRDLNGDVIPRDELEVWQIHFEANVTAGTSSAGPSSSAARPTTPTGR